MSAQTTEQQPAPVVPAVSRIEWAPVPRVNLLPPEILEGRRFRRTQLLLGLAVLLTLGLAGAATVWAAGGVADAQAQLDAADARIAQLQTRQAQYAEVPRVNAEVEAATAARATAMGTDVTWYRYLGDLQAALPAGVSITSVSMSTTGAGGAGAVTDPLTTAGVAGLTIDGTAPTYPAVSAWLEALDRLKGIDSVSLSNAADAKDSSGNPTVTFSSAAVVTADALSHLFDEGTTG